MMATQDESGIEFCLCPEDDQQQFRLLELSAELLTLLTSDNPPILHLKSQVDANSVLCTPNRTYDLRQVSTSNSVYVVRDDAPTISSDVHDLPQHRLEAIAQPQSTLELLPIKDPSAVPHILAGLPTYTSNGHYSSKDAASKQQIFANIPLSDAECEQAWTELSCFELQESRHGVVPSSSVMLMAWRAMMDASTAMGIDLTRPLDRNARASIIESDMDWPQELLTALLTSMSSRSSDSNDIVLDERKCARILGLTLLKDRTESSKASISMTNFKMDWEDFLPEKWRSRAELDLLDGWYQLENGGQSIAYFEKSADNNASANGASSEETKSTLGSKRKWHEKFRAAKKSA